MIDETEQQKLQARVARFDTLFRYCGLGAILAVLGLVVLVVILQVQTQQQINDTLAAIKASGSANHAKTQSYIKCVAEELLKEPQDRTQADLDSCGIYGSDPNKLKSLTPSTAPSATTNEQSESVTVPQSQTTTSGSGDDPTTNGSTGVTVTTPVSSGQNNILRGIPIIGNTLQKLNI